MNDEPSGNAAIEPAADVAPAPTTAVAASASPRTHHTRIEWAIVLLAFTGPLIESAVQMRILYEEFAPSVMFGQHPLALGAQGLIHAAASLMLLLYLLHLRRVRLRRLGLRRRPRDADVLFGLAISVGLFGVAYALRGIIGDGDWQDMAARYMQAWRDSGAVDRWPWTLGLLIVIAQIAVNSVLEELLRAYFVWRTRDAWGGSVWYGVGLSVVIFAAYHTYYSGASLLPVVAIGSAFAIYMAQRRDVWGPIIAHTLVNLYSLGTIYLG